MIAIITKRPNRTIKVDNVGVTVYTDKKTGKDIYKLFTLLPFCAEATSNTTPTMMGKCATVYKEKEVTLARFNTLEEAENAKEMVDSAIEVGARTIRL